MRTHRFLNHLLAAGSALALGAPASAQLPLLPGDDPILALPTQPGAQASTTLDCSIYPIPAGACGVGSDPFLGTITLKPRPIATSPPGLLDDASAVLRRLQPASPPLGGPPAVVPIEMVALSLVSAEPITVTFNGGITQMQFDVVLRCSSATPSPGTMRIELDHPDGGVFEYDVLLAAGLDVYDVNGVQVGAVDSYASLSLSSRRIPWLLEGGPAGFSSDDLGATPPPPGTMFDSNGDGVPDDAIFGDSTFQGFAAQTCLGTFTSERGGVKDDAGGFEGTEGTPGDKDGDGWSDGKDACDCDPDPANADTDGDGIGDVCDETPYGEPMRPVIGEVLARHDGGVQDLEFIEIAGEPGTSLDGYALVAVDGDNGASIGRLDFYQPLTGFSIPASGLFLVGGPGVAIADLMVPFPNFLEDGSQTLFLVYSVVPGGFQGQIGDDLDPDRNNQTSLACDFDEIVDLVALWDGDVYDRAYDGAYSLAYGPDGGFAPAGIFRVPGAAGPAGPWCSTSFLGSDLQGLQGEIATPGVPNVSCGTAPNAGDPFCFGLIGAPGCSCGNFTDAYNGCANSTGGGGALVAVGDAAVRQGDLDLVLFGTGLPLGTPGLFFQGVSQVNGGLGAAFGDGLRCAGGQVRRLEVAFADLHGVARTTVDIAAVGGVVAGEIRPYQLWYRDNAGSPCGFNFNTTNALLVEWLP